MKNKADTMFSCTRLDDFFVWEKKKLKYSSLNYDYKNRKRRQDVKKQFLNGILLWVFSPSFVNTYSSSTQCVDSNKYLAVITLGCVIKGETDHYDYICQAVSNGVMNVSIKSNIPVLFGVLTCQNSQLAFERSRDNDFNKGFEVGNATKKLLALDL